MTCRLKDGPRTWSGQRDKDGYRTYKVRWMVLSDNPKDGPSTVMDTPGLPQPGAEWLIDNDADEWAWCEQDMIVRLAPEYKEGEQATVWVVEQTFSTNLNVKRCQDIKVEDPLMEPQKLSGSLVKYTEEAVKDRFGTPILTSSHEQIRGPQVEFDANRWTVKVEQNVPTLDLALVAPMANTVNVFPLWGLPPRCIKLSGFSWERKYFGQCYRYYTRSFEFDVFMKVDENGVASSGFDRDVLDEGTKVLNGHWDRATGKWELDKIAGEDPDPNNPAHFIRFQDRHGNTARVILDGHGEPFDPDPPTLVTDCSQCPDGAPMVWRGLSIESLGGKIGTVDLTSSGGCDWTGQHSETGEPFTLEYDGAEDEWKFTGTLSGFVYVLAGDEWACDGANVMTTVPSQNTPESITVEPIEDTIKPGEIHLEKYEESDFLLLGIPVDLETDY